MEKWELSFGLCVEFVFGEYMDIYFGVIVVEVVVSGGIFS